MILGLGTTPEEVSKNHPLLQDCRPGELLIEKITPINEKLSIGQMFNRSGMAENPENRAILEALLTMQYREGMEQGSSMAQQQAADLARICAEEE